MKKSTLALIGFFALLLVLPASVKAYEARKGDTINVAKDQVIDGNFYTAGSNINIDGRIKGDLFCAGQTINIKGIVDGSVFCAGQNINLDGTVAGSARIAGNSINITGTVGQNVNAFGASVNYDVKAKAGWDMVIATASANINGQIGRDLLGAGANVSLNGKVGQNVKLALGEKKNQTSFDIGDNAQIGGRLEYWSAKEANISSKAKIAGEKIRREFKPREDRGSRVASAITFGIIFSLFSSLVVGLVIISLFRKQTLAITGLMKEKIAASIGIGLVGLVVMPFILIILAITVIGIPLALIILALWLVILYLSKIMTGIFIGRILVEKYWPAKKESLIWFMIIGILILYILGLIPILGWLIAFIAVLWSLGAILQFLKNAER